MKVKFYIFFLVAMLCSVSNQAQEQFLLNVEIPQEINESSMIMGINANCPNDIIVQANPGSNGARVQWAPISISTDCSFCTNRIPNCLYMGDYNGHQYYCSLFETNKNSASSFAASYGAYLGSINSQNENDFLSSRLVNTSAYIGLSDEQTESVYRWESNQNFSYSEWEPGMPNDPTGVKDAVAMQSNGKWYDCHPNDWKEFIVEFPCIDVELIQGLPNGSFFPIGTTLVYYVFTDACGAETTCHFNVTVEGSGGINLECPDDIWVECQDNLQGAYVSWPKPTGSTDCPCTNHVPNCIDMGWHKNSQYFCSLFNSTWTDARTWAQNNDTELTVILDAGANNYLASQLMQNNAYIGLHDEDGNGTFEWIDGSPLNYTSWDVGEPSNLGANRYVEITPYGKWKTIPGWTKKEFICEETCLEIHQSRGPSNGQFFPLGTTIVEYTATDDCGNRTTCSFEVSVEGGVSIDCPDDIIVACEQSWQGNYVTWPEPTAHTCCTQCTNGQNINGFIYLGNQNGSSYYCSNFNANWTDAEAYCVANGGHLVSIESNTENNYVSSRLMAQDAFIGLNDFQQEGSFVWSNSSNSAYRNWRFNQPMNTQNLDFTVISPSGEWRLMDHYVEKEFIMERACTHIIQVEGKPNGSFFTEGTHRIKYKVTDGCGDSDYCEFYVTVESCCNSNFQVVCPADYIGCPGDDINPATIGDATVDLIENCGSVRISYTDRYNFNNSCRKEIERTWRAEETNNPSNYDECSQWIDLIDSEAPYYTDFPADLDIGCSDPLPRNQPIWADDDCGLASIEHRDSTVVNDCATGITVFRIFTATDDCGNEASRTQRIQREGDTDDPQIFNCPDDIVLPAEGEDCNRRVYWTEPYASDNCSQVNLTSNFSPGTLFSEGTHQVEYIATDGCGNTEYCRFTISITGGNCCTKPTLTCPEDYNNCPGLPTHPIHTGYPIVNADTSNCGRYELGFWDEDIQPGACAGEVKIFRTWDVYYFNNPTEKSVCIQEVHLVDNEGPIIDNCIDNIYLETDSCCSKQVYWQVPIASDDCGLLSFSSNYQPGDWFPPGNTEVKYTATDLCGNTAVCFLNIFIECELVTGYCTSKAESSDHSWIESIEINNMSNHSGNNCGYGHYDDMEILLDVASTYSMSLNVGKINQNESGYWKVWIDINGDGDFDDQLETVYDSEGLMYNNILTDIYIPSFSKKGASMMRVSYQSMSSMSEGSVQNCCDIFDKGEVEDYKIYLGSIVDNNEKEAIEDIIQVYPNPSTGKFNLEIISENIYGGNVQIINLLGEVIYSASVNSFANFKDNVDISVVNNGIYILKAQLNNKTYFKEIVILK